MKERKAHYKTKFPGELSGYQLHFNKIALGIGRAGYANLMPVTDESKVCGIIYECTSHETLETLDMHEGTNGFKQGHYYRKQVEVFVPVLSKTVRAITYLACDHCVADGLLPLKNYLQHLLEGKDLLPPEYYQKLCNVETLE